MTPFENAIARTVGVEGVDSNDPADRGGRTRWGITEAVALSWGYLGEMADMPWSTMTAIYKAVYWDKLLLNDIALLSESVALEVFDTTVNCGVGTEVRFLQRALNALNNGALAYPDLHVDGSVGPATAKALASFLAKRGRDGELVLLAILNSLQCAHYVEIVEADPTQEKWFYGWVRARVVAAAQ